MWFLRRQGPQAVGIAVTEREDPEDDRGYVTAELVVGRRHLAAVDHGPLDLAQLQESCIRPGRYFIWTCTCGCAGCAGRFQGVQVSHCDGVAIWHDRDSGKRYRFRLPELSAALTEAWRQGRGLLAVEKRVPCPETNADFFAEPEPGSVKHC